MIFITSEMKTAIVAFSILLSACADRSDRNDTAETKESGYSPSEVVLNLYKAMAEGDSVAIINTLSSDAKVWLLPQINRVGGFQTLFIATKGMHYDTKILKVDTTSETTARVFVKQKFDEDSSIHIQLDSLYYSVRKEDGGWKLINLKAKKARQEQ